jgi:vanillate O-demethylase ferredoxin subunit
MAGLAAERVMTLSVKVLRKTQAAEDIASFELADPSGAPLPAFSAGSHIDVHVPGGLTRQYSLCNDAEGRHLYRIAVLRDPASRGGSTGMHDRVAEGDMLQIGEPRNLFPLVHARRTLLFAGGIGVTPLLCMAQRLHAIGADFGLHYCCRTPARTAFRDEILNSGFADRAVFHFDDGEPAQKLDLEAALAVCDPGTHVYVCGPGGFINAVVQIAKAKGWPDDQVHLEFFGAAPQDVSGDRPFQVKLASRGHIIDVAANETVVAALRRHSIEIAVSCEQGICGTCVTRVLDGNCDHRDLFFSDEEKARNDQFTPCCSRSRGAMLVLDI